MPFLSGYGQWQGAPQQGQPMSNIPGFQPQQGLMANPAAFMFLDAMMNQPGGFNASALPGYGTQNPFGMPMYLPQVISPRTLQPAPVATVSPPPTTYNPGTTSGGTGDRTGSER